MESPGAAPSSTLLVLQLKSLVAYKSNDEYLYAMKEDLAEWFMCLYQLDITVDNFFEVLETGVILCEHANNVRNYANEQRKLGKFAVIQSNFVRGMLIPEYEVPFRTGVKPQTFQARDNLSNFISWTKDLGIPEVLSFETDDLVLRKNEKSVVLCLLEVARVGAKLGMLAPTLVRMEEEIDKEIESGEPPPQIITCDLKSLDEMVQWLAGRCTCPKQFPIIKVGEGKYKIGDSQTLVFVRILRNHVMIRVGGGWDTLEHYLDKHDPCRCGFSGHRQTGSVTKTPTRRASTPAVSHSVPTPSKSQKKLSMMPNSTSGGYTSISNSQRPASPVRMRSVSPGPSPKGLPDHNSGITKPPFTPLSPSGKVNNSHVLVQKTYSVPSTPRRSQSPVQVSRLRSPSPVSTVSRSFVSQQRESLQSRVPRPSSPVKRANSPGPCITPASARGCVSPSPRSTTASPGPNRRNILSIPRSKSTTPQIERRQLPHRPNMDSSGNDSEETDVTSGSSQPAVDMNQISTMTLDEFKNLLNNALSVPNRSVSEGSQESPRSQSSMEEPRTSSNANRTGGMKKTPVADKSPIHKNGNRNVSQSLNSHGNVSDKSNTTRTNAPNGYYEMEKPAVRRTILASSANHRPKTPVSNVTASRPKTPTSSRPKTPVSSVSVNRPKTPVSVSRPKTPVSLAILKTPVDTSKSKPTTSTSSNIQNATKQMSVTRGISYQTHSAVHSHYTTKLLNSSNLFEEKPASETGTTTDQPNVSYVCIKADDLEDVKACHRSGTYSNSSQSSGVKTTCSQDSADVVSRVHDNCNTETKGDSTGSGDSLIQSFNALQKSIAELRNRAQQACIAGDILRKDGDTSLKKTEEESVQSVNRNTEKTSSTCIKPKSASLSKTYGVSSSYDVSNNSSNECIPVGILKRSQTLEESFGKSETDISDTSNRRASQGDSVSSEQVRHPSTPLGRPATPTGRPSTPSLIPRPMTPVEGLAKPQITSESFLLQPTSSRSEAAKIGSKRPPTPKKATILAKSPSSVRNATRKSVSENSYRSIFQNKRSTTPGPNEFRSMSLSERESQMPRRSVTPGPETRRGGRAPLQQWRSQSVTQVKDQSKNENCNTDNSIVERNRIRAASASPMIPRKPQNQTPRAITRQKAVEENITVTVDRDSGRHSISVRDGENTRYKSDRPVARVLARAPTPTKRASGVENSDSDTPGHTRTSDAPMSRPRARSVDPEQWRRDKEEEVVMVVQRTDKGGHKVQDRTEAWVESAAKTVASRTPTSTRKVSENLRRSKTPNPNNVYEKEFQSRSLSEIKASLSLPVNGLKEVNPDDLDAPPEDPEMYAKMEVLFQKMRERELKASVNETPGQVFMPDLDVEGIEHEDESSLDSNENIKRKSNVSRGSSPASRVQSSVSPTPPRSKTPSMSRSSSSSQPLARPLSTTPRPSTPTRSSFNSSRRSSSKSSNESVPSPSPSSAPVPSPGSAPLQHPISSNVDHAVVIVSKIKEILNPKPRKDEKMGPRSRIPAPKTLASSGKSKSFSNLSSPSSSEWSLKKHNIVDQTYINGNACYDNCDEYDIGDEISGITARLENSCGSDNYRSQSGTKTPVPKLATPLTTGRKAVLNREFSEKSSKLVRAVSISSLSSSSNTTNTMSCPTQDDEEFV